MAFTKLLALLLLNQNFAQEFNLAKAFSTLNRPKEALEILDTLHENTTDQELFQILLLQSQEQLALNKPYEALKLLQPLLQLDTLSSLQKAQIFDLVSKAFLKLKKPQRAVFYATLAENSRCDWSHILGDTTCKPAPVDEVDDTPEAAQALGGSVFDLAIAKQKEALELTKSLPFIDPYSDTAYLQALEIQKNIQSFKDPFVALVLSKEKKINCDSAPFVATTSRFTEALDLAKLAETALIQKDFTFAKVIPLQLKTIEKLQEAKTAFAAIEKQSPKDQTPQNEKELQDFKTLQNMMHLDQKNAKPVQGQVEKKVW